MRFVQTPLSFRLSYALGDTRLFFLSSDEGRKRRLLGRVDSRGTEANGRSRGEDDAGGEPKACRQGAPPRATRKPPSYTKRQRNKDLPMHYVLLCALINTASELGPPHTHTLNKYSFPPVQLQPFVRLLPLRAYPCGRDGFGNLNEKPINGRAWKWQRIVLRCRVWYRRRWTGAPRSIGGSWCIRPSCERRREPFR